MRHIIVEKLNRIIEDGVDSEAKALYVLTQCRKLLEIVDSEQRRTNYPTFSLIGDWVVHSKLNGRGAIAKLKEYADFFAKQQNLGMFEFMDSGFTLFPDLKEDLRKIFTSENIDERLISDRGIWLKFVKILIEILTDLPLVGEGEIKQFAFDEGFSVDDTEGVSFSILFADGKNKHFTLDLELLDRPR